MADLAALAEVGRLRHELGVDGDQLDFLVRHDAADLRALRHALTDALAAPHRPAFQRMAAAARLLPAPVTATIAAKALGPFLCSKVAAELDPTEARKLVGHLRVPFLADLCRTLDPRAAADVIRAIPAERAVAVGVELYRRRDLETLARFIDVVAEDTIPRMLDVVDDDGCLLEIAVAAESRLRLDAIFAMLPDDRVLGVVESAALSDQLTEAVVLLGELGQEQAARAIGLVVGSGHVLLTDLVAEISRLGGWDELLPVMAGLDPDVLATVASSPALDRPELFLAVARDVVDAGLGPEIVALVGAMPDDRQEQLARSLAGSAPQVARHLAELVETVTGASDLAAARALREALGP